MRFHTALLVGCCVFFASFLSLHPESRPQSLLRDFNAFYCAGSAIARHADPYRNEPLGACERSRDRPAFLSNGAPYLAVPAPLPGYALAPFALLALLPYGVAACLWTLLLLACLALTIVRLRSLTSAPLAVVVAATALSDGYTGITLGQIAPIAIAAVVESAYAVSREQTTRAACAAAAAMLEPHIGLPACLALVVFRPRTIAVLAPAGILCAGLSLAVLGADETKEYFTSVIGAHALSETVNVKQLSLTALLVRLGVPALAALRAGTFWYAAMILFGIALGRRAAADSHRPAFAVLFPVAFAMIGGSFVHIAQIAAVMPAALLLAYAYPAKRLAAAASILLLAVPWPQFSSLGTSFPLLAALAAGTLAFGLLPASPAWRIAPPLLAFLFATIPTQLQGPIADPASRMRTTYDPRALAQMSWSSYVALVGTRNQTAYDLARFPTVAGLLIFALSASRAVLSVTPICARKQ